MSKPKSTLPSLLVTIFASTSFLAIGHGVFSNGHSGWWFLFWALAVLIHGGILQSLID